MVKYPTLLHRLHFSLGTLFVTTTLLAAVVAYHVHWMQQRHNALVEYRMLEGRVTGVKGPPGGTIYIVSPGVCDAPWPLRWMGERGIKTILTRPPLKGAGAADCPTDDDVALRRRLQRLFPEAEFKRASDVNRNRALSETP